MSLPNELIDQVLSFVHASTQPATLRNPRIREVGLQPGALTMDARFQVEDFRGELRLVYDGFEDPGALSGPLGPSLKALRLLSRAWNHGVSRLLARHWPVTIKTGDHDSITRALNRCTPGLGGAPRYLKLLAGHSIRPTIRIYHHDWRTMIHEVDSRGETLPRLFKDWPMLQGLYLGNDKSLRGRIERGNRC